VCPDAIDEVPGGFDCAETLLRSTMSP
jgi:hypothetical protein